MNIKLIKFVGILIFLIGLMATIVELYALSLGINGQVLMLYMVMVVSITSAYVGVLSGGRIYGKEREIEERIKGIIDKGKTIKEIYEDYAKDTKAIEEKYKDLKEVPREVIEKLFYENFGSEEETGSDKS